MLGLSIFNCICFSGFIYQESVRMVILENPPVYNIIFIVEGTANVGAYFDHLKSAYILPALE